MTSHVAPRKDIGWNSLTQLTEVNGHVQSTWTAESQKWSEPEFKEDPYLRVHGLAPAFNYGQEAYEGMKAFRGPGDQTINIFRPEFHALRLNHSSSLVSIPSIPEEHFLQSVKLAVAKNAEFAPPNEASCMLYIRPVVFGTGPRVMLSPTDEYTFVVYVLPVSAYHGLSPLKAMILEDFDRAAPRGTGSGKVGGNYAPVMAWSDKAKKEGYAITLHLDSQTRTQIDEFSTSAFIGAKPDGDKFQLTIPDSKNAVNSVTSNSIQELAKSIGWKVEKRPVMYEELFDFSEVLACGTAVTLVAIKSITRQGTDETFVYQNGADTPGPCATLLSKMMEDIQKGRVADKFNWLTSA